MSVTKKRAQGSLQAIREALSGDDLRARLAPKPGQPLPPAIRPTKTISLKALDSYWRLLTRERGLDEADKACFADPETRDRLADYERNIEACIGTLKLPVGIIGPLRVNGIFAQGDYYLPLATSEATLVASYARGARLISACGGCATALINDGLTRAPVFAFATLVEAGLFVDWVLEHFDDLKAVAEATTAHGRLIDLRPHMEGNHVYLSCEFLTGDAAGQNMSTIATDALCRHILAEAPVAPEYWFLEGNFSGDKKASALSFLSVRGKKVMAEVRIPADLVAQHLATDIETMQRYWRVSALGGVMSGTIGVQGHYANGLTAFYLATGQDAACAAESSIGVTRMEIDGDHLYCSVTLPNVIVGTVGGGTRLPSQAVGLKILGLAGEGGARALAELCAALSLAGELSLIGAICAGHFAQAHKSLARGR